MLTEIIIYNHLPKADTYVLKIPPKLCNSLKTAIEAVSLVTLLYTCLGLSATQ